MKMEDEEEEEAAVELLIGFGKHNVSAQSVGARSARREGRRKEEGGGRRER